MIRLLIYLSEPEAAAIARLAAEELRTPRDQARHLLRLALEQRGFLPDAACLPQPAPSDEPQKS